MKKKPIVLLLSCSLLLSSLLGAGEDQNSSANRLRDALFAEEADRDLAKAERYAAGLRYGEVQINGVKYDIDLPHGGIGQSGIGHDCSHLALHDYLVLKRITRALDTGAAA